MLAEVIVRVLLFAAGVLVVAKTVSSAIHTFVVPRGVPDMLTRIVFRSMGTLFGARARRASTYLERDRIMALYSPLSLLTLPVVWLALILLGYTAMFWSLGIRPVTRAVTASGSSLLTLGFAALHSQAQTLLAFTEAALGLIMIALLIAYLPTMYGAWSRREAQVAALEVRAGTPPSALEMILRFQALGQLDRIPELWVPWEVWFLDIEESHTSLAPLTYFRSPQPQRSWVTAAGAVLDTASFFSSTLAVPRDPQAELCIRAGYLALRQIASFFGYQFDEDPHFPRSPISVSREEWDAAVEEMARAGVPLKPDRDQAWSDWAGWRVNYDAVLLVLASLTMAPYAPWSSDRSLRREGNRIVSVPPEEPIKPRPRART